MDKQKQLAKSAKPLLSKKNEEKDQTQSLIDQIKSVKEFVFRVFSIQFV